MNNNRKTVLLLATVALLPLSGCADDANETADNEAAYSSREEARDALLDEHQPEESPVNERRYDVAYGDTDQGDSRGTSDRDSNNTSNRDSSFEDSDARARDDHFDGIDADNRNSSFDDIKAHIRLETRYATNDDLSALQIDTDVRNGVAYLSGEVESDAHRQLAAEEAADVEGVLSIRNNLQVSGTEGQSDVELESDVTEDAGSMAEDLRITSSVMARLKASANTAGLLIDVDTDEQVVTLRGDVPDDNGRELAGLIARNTSGVREVRNRLNVKPD